MTTKFRECPKTLAIVVGCLAICGCVKTSIFAPEYRHEYALTDDQFAYPCDVFTGQWSVLFGPKSVLCIGSQYASENAAGIYFPKGSAVRVQKLMKINAIDISYHTARIRIVQPGTGREKIMYAQWPELSKHLVKVK
jgi:hypothetical protein